MTGLSQNLAEVRRRIAVACGRSGRPMDAVRLIAVSKGFEAEVIAKAIAAEQQDFGESYLQEALPKIASVAKPCALAPCWHFIGPIQSNKTSAIAAHFDWAHAVDRLKIAERLSAQRRHDQSPLEVCVQVNISGETSKAGCLPLEAEALCASVAALPHLRLRGLMCIPAAVDDPEASRDSFRRMRELQVSIRTAGHVESADFDTLSMGMSDDFEVAIEEGATLVRVGSAIFGARA